MYQSQISKKIFSPIIQWRLFLVLCAMSTVVFNSVSIPLRQDLYDWVSNNPKKAALLGLGGIAYSYNRFAPVVRIPRRSEVTLFDRDAYEKLPVEYKKWLSDELKAEGGTLYFDHKKYPKDRDEYEKLPAEDRKRVEAELEKEGQRLHFEQDDFEHAYNIGYRGRSLAAFEKEDRVLQKTLNQVWHDIFIIKTGNWTGMVFGDRFKRLQGAALMLQEKLVRIKATERKVKEDLSLYEKRLNDLHIRAKAEEERRPQNWGDLGLSLLVLPWRVLLEDTEKELAAKILQTKKDIKAVEEAHSFVKNKIIEIDNILQSYHV